MCIGPSIKCQNKRLPYYICTYVNVFISFLVTLQLTKLGQSKHGYLIKIWYPRVITSNEYEHTATTKDYRTVGLMTPWRRAESIYIHICESFRTPCCPTPRDRSVDLEACQVGIWYKLGVPEIQWKKKPLHIDIYGASNT